MKRRSFITALFGVFGAASAAPIVNIGNNKIFIPGDVGNDEIVIAKSLIVPGDVIFGYMFTPDDIRYVDLMELSKDAIQHFPGNGKTVILSSQSCSGFNRFMFKGAESQLLNYTKAKMAGGFESANAFAFLSQEKFGSILRKK